MIIGFSLSPGGLLLPYHLGVLSSLQSRGFLEESTPLAGSSAGSIAVSSFCSGVNTEQTLEATIRVSDRCAELGGARGRLLPFLREEMENLLPSDAHEVVNERTGLVGLAHRELFPVNRPVLATNFETRDCLMDAVMDSSTFPFFSTNWPCRLVTRRGERMPRVVVDGFFSVPRERYGCPDFSHAASPTSKLSTISVQGATDTAAEKSDTMVEAVDECINFSEGLLSNCGKSLPDRVVTVAVFPHETVGLTASESHDSISPPPEEDSVEQMSNILKLATQASSRKELTDLYEKGLEDGERWATEEEQRDVDSMLDRRREFGVAVTDLN
eukprot:CAMPEP_0113588406 /NCGR_PEP_ID=MMETSP0015_2-20120614/35495_1 /TAXON_ID=2838 /ORGANISM="Odontella" /LENGTH=327 /DNA_ID=CAMNT_0000494271 /DNA_START=50 /DNA_END=1033 /DNA_ORIENTATION=- /assembly_acc=CAM_ASM_000160